MYKRVYISALVLSERNCLSMTLCQLSTDSANFVSRKKIYENTTEILIQFAMPIIIKFLIDLILTWCIGFDRPTCNRPPVILIPWIYQDECLMNGEISWWPLLGLIYWYHTMLINSLQHNWIDICVIRRVKLSGFKYERYVFTFG